MCQISLKIWWSNKEEKEIYLKVNNETCPYTSKQKILWFLKAETMLYVYFMISPFSSTVQVKEKIAILKNKKLY